MNPKHPPGPPMDLANMRRQGVRSLIAYCLNDSCRHQALKLEPLVVAEIKVGLGAVIGHEHFAVFAYSRVRTFNPDGGGSVSNASSVGQAGSR
jgi:hypothetical protein